MGAMTLGRGMGFLLLTALAAGCGGGSSRGPDGGAGPDGGGPPGSPTAICGADLLKGPATAPAGAVVVSPGATSLQDAINGHPAGTTYYLTAGTYAIGDSIQPQNGDHFIGAPGAVIDGGGSQPVAFGMNNHASGVTIEHLTIQNFNGVLNNGIINQGQGADWTLEYSTINNPTIDATGGNGIELGDDNVVRFNCFVDNAQNGIAGGGTRGIVIDHNEIKGTANGFDDSNCGCAAGMKLYITDHVTISNNWIHDNRSAGVWIDTNNTFVLIDGNTIENNDDEGIIYEISYNVTITNNVLRKNAGPKNNQNNPGFPNAAIYISNSGGFDAGAPVMLGGVDVNGAIRIAHNTFDEDPNGVTLYEDTNRLCNASGCAQGQDPHPLYDEIDGANHRWNTQRVSVTDNTFTFTLAGSGCDAAHALCGVNAAIATESSVINLATGEDNHFDHNEYTGAWRFLAPDQSSQPVSSSVWQTTFHQDADSTFSP
jgi:hypothetical protein